MNATTNETMTLEQFNVISDVFSQAITGELIGMSNFASLTDTIDDPHEKMEAVEHANSKDTMPKVLPLMRIKKV